MAHARSMMDDYGNRHTLRIFNTEDFHGNNVSYTYTACFVHFDTASWQTMGPQQDSYLMEYAGSFTEDHVQLKLLSI